MAALASGEADISPVNTATTKQVEGAGGRFVYSQAGAILEPRFVGCFEPLYVILQERYEEFSPGYLNIPWGVRSRILTWAPRPLVSHPSAIWTITLK